MTTALLVIDIQRGAFDGVRCPPIDSPERLVGSATALVSAARAGGHAVVFVQHCAAADEPLGEGTEQWRLHEALVAAPGDLVVKKHASSSFEGTDLGAELEVRGVRDLVVCGLQSEFCVSSTTRSALALGYRVRIASDGHGTWPSGGRTADEIRAEINTTMAGAGATLFTTHDLQMELQRKPACLCRLDWPLGALTTW